MGSCGNLKASKVSVNVTSTLSYYTSESAEAVDYYAFSDSDVAKGEAYSKKPQAICGTLGTARTDSWFYNRVPDCRNAGDVLLTLNGSPTCAVGVFTGEITLYPKIEVATIIADNPFYENIAISLPDTPKGKKFTIKAWLFGGAHGTYYTIKEDKHVFTGFGGGGNYFPGNECGLAMTEDQTEILIEKASQAVVVQNPSAINVSAFDSAYPKYIGDLTVTITNLAGKRMCTTQPYGCTASPKQTFAVVEWPWLCRGSFAKGYVTDLAGSLDGVIKPTPGLGSNYASLHADITTLKHVEHGGLTHHATGASYNHYASDVGDFLYTKYSEACTATWSPSDHKRWHWVPYVIYLSRGIIAVTPIINTNAADNSLSQFEAMTAIRNYESECNPFWGCMNPTGGNVKWTDDYGDSGNFYYDTDWCSIGYFETEVEAQAFADTAHRCVLRKPQNPYDGPWMLDEIKVPCYRTYQYDLYPADPRTSFTHTWGMVNGLSWTLSHTTDWDTKKNAFGPYTWNVANSAYGPSANSYLLKEATFEKQKYRLAGPCADLSTTDINGEEDPLTYQSIVAGTYNTWKPPDNELGCRAKYKVPLGVPMVWSRKKQPGADADLYYYSDEGEPTYCDGRGNKEACCKAYFDANEWRYDGIANQVTAQTEAWTDAGYTYLGNPCDEGVYVNTFKDGCVSTSPPCETKVSDIAEGSYWCDSRYDTCGCSFNGYPGSCVGGYCYVTHDDWNTDEYDGYYYEFRLSFYRRAILICATIVEPTPPE